ncbi:hypothetical protein [Loktanella sp. S4079]|uniref:hypothetical protein n=1 Tax=Loktanella sp. S4079 TaxID=579483 RepID=UPI0005FA0D20|nr:hypothetical protein [Loktanella sp. S4079]KJZ19844.1 hypothetical protein TW80_02880 [Loktanella sp. S4079]
MKHLALVLGIWAGPVLAYDTLTTRDCQTLWDRFVVGLRPHEIFGDTQPATVVQANDSGACVIDGRQFDSQPFETLRFQVDGAHVFLAEGILPTSAQFAIEQLHWRGSERRYDLRFALNHDPAAGQLHLDHFTLSQPQDQSGVDVDIVVGGAYFSTLAGLQSSIGGLHVKAVAGSANINPALLSDLEIDLSALTRANLAIALRDVGQDTVSTSSRNALLEMSTMKRGTLDFDLTSENGLGWIQLALPYAQIVEAETDEEISTGFGRLLSGVELGLSWDTGDF